ncbi:MAG: replication-associated recombination protein A [Sphingobacteriaceae bacterium]|nr:replication-associated recombination protein A [Sphingobacteriaceae bacterium]
MNNAPLAERMRPKKLDDYVGQTHLVGPNGIIRRMIQQQNLPSLLFWGPPGVGKTTLAQLIAQSMKRPFHVLSAVQAGVKDVREVIGRGGGMFAPVLFIDEIHRFSKSQQDALLAAVEKGQITLIGATTENPSFEVNAALLSRCQVYLLESLSKDELLQIVTHALEKDELLSKRKIEVAEHQVLLQLSGGDARKLLNLIELVADSQAPDQPTTITDELVLACAQQHIARYDKSGEQHYDIISAFIKSLRGSDPNAAVYYLARMIVGGEDPTFIARRMLIMASEDIGNANPTAMILAKSCMDAVKMLGYPEARIVLSQTAVYLATSAKSNASYVAIDAAIDLVNKTGDLPVPLHLRNAPTKLMKEIGYGKGYQYSHDGPGNFIRQEFLPDDIIGAMLFDPGGNPREKEMREQLKKWWGDKYKY